MRLSNWILDFCKRKGTPLQPSRNISREILGEPLSESLSFLPNKPYGAFSTCRLSSSHLLTQSLQSILCIDTTHRYRRAHARSHAATRAHAHPRPRPRKHTPRMHTPRKHTPARAHARPRTCPSAHKPTRDAHPHARTRLNALTPTRPGPVRTSEARCALPGPANLNLAHGSLRDSGSTRNLSFRRRVAAGARPLRSTARWPAGAALESRSRSWRLWSRLSNPSTFPTQM